MKRILSVLLTLLATVMVGGLLSATAFAADGAAHGCGLPVQDCLVCDVAGKINALPAAEEITVENAAAVTDQLHAIDRRKVELTWDQYTELLTLVESGIDSSGYGTVPVRYTQAVDAVRALGGTSLTITKSFVAAEGSAVDVSGAEVRFEITNVSTNTSTLVTLSTMPYVANSLSATAGFYCANAEGDGWSYKYILPAGTYTVREVSDSGATVNGEAFITASTTYTLDGAKSTGSATVTVGGGDRTVIVFNSLFPEVTVNFVDQNGTTVPGPKMTFTADGEEAITLESGGEPKEMNPNVQWTPEITDVPEGYVVPFTLPDYFDLSTQHGFKDETGGSPVIPNLQYSASDYTITVVLAKPTTLSLMDGVDGLPLENVNIEYVSSDEEEATPPDFTCDNEYQVSFETMRSFHIGAHTYKVTAPGYEPAQITITVAAEDVAGVSGVLVATVKQGETEITDGVIQLDRPTQKILAVDAEGKPLEGAMLWLYDGEDKVADWTSGAAPYEAKSIRPGGSYTLLVAANPTGYCVPEPVLDIWVDEDGVVDYDGTVREEDGVLLVEFAKTRIGISTFYHDQPLEGARIQLFRVDNGVETLVEDFSAMPAALFVDGLPTNRLYVLRMIEAPAGYSLAQDIYFVIGGNGEVGSVEGYNSAPVSEDNVILIDLPANVVQIMTSTPLATFDITYEKDGKTALFGTFDTGLIGAHQITGFVPGVEYTITFRQIPGGPIKPEPFTFALAADGSLLAEGVEDLVLIEEENNCIFFVTLQPNIDTDNDGKPDLNEDTNGDGKADSNIDTDGDGKPDLNVDTNGDGKPDVNVDTNGDFQPDINIDTDGDGKADINIDTNGDGKADVNIDADGDGKPDTNLNTGSKPASGSPQTGDNSSLLLWTALALISGGLLGFVACGKKRKLI